MSQLINVDSEKKEKRGAEVKASLVRDEQLKDIATVCATPQGRRFIWRLLEKCKTFESIWENSARIHYQAGQQDLGHFLMSEIVETDEQLLFKLMSENKKMEKV